MRPKLRGPHDERIFEQAARGEIGEETRDRLVDGARMGAVVLLQRAMRVPAGVVAGAKHVDRTGDDMHEAHVALDQTAGAQQHRAHVARRIFVETVKLLRRFRLLRQIDGFGRVDSMR